MQFLPTIRSAAPSAPVGVNRGNPIAAGLKLAWFASTGIDHVSGAQATNSDRANNTPGQNQYGATLRCSGAQSMESYTVPHITAMDGGSEFTVFTVSTTNSDAQRPLAGVWGAALSAKQFYLAINPSRFPFISVTNGSTNRVYMANVATVPAGVRVTVAGGWKSSGDACSIWLNGSPVTGTKSGSTIPAMSTVPNPLSIASQGAGGTAALSGDIELVLIFNRLLSDAEIRSLTNNPYQVLEPPRRALWLDVIAGGGTDGTATPLGVAAAASIRQATVTGDAVISAAGSTLSATVEPLQVTASATAAPSSVASQAYSQAVSAAGSASAATVGISVESYTGTVVATAPVATTVTGVACGLAAGAATVTGGASATPTGVYAAVDATALVVSASAQTTLSGSAAGTTIGVPTVTGYAVAQIAGIGSTASVGAVVSGNSAFCAPPGVQAAAHVGYTAATASAIAAPPGVAATATAGAAMLHGDAVCSAQGTVAVAAAGVSAAGVSAAAEVASLLVLAATGVVGLAADALATVAGEAASALTGTLTFIADALAGPFGLSVDTLVGSVTSLESHPFAPALPEAVVLRTVDPFIVVQLDPIKTVLLRGDVPDLVRGA